LFYKTLKIKVPTHRNYNMSPLQDRSVSAV
jgi:hypothetical protein